MGVNVGRSVVTTGAQGTPGVRAYQSLQPLYSSVALDAAAVPSEITFFGYKRGDNVPGAGNAGGFASTTFHTNMRLAGQLPRPQLFICEGVRLFMPQIAFTSTSNTPEVSDSGFSLTTGPNADLLDDLQLLTYSSWFTLTLGERDYVDHPLIFLPSNLGYDGIGTVSEDNVSGNAIMSQDATLVNTFGAGTVFWPFETIDGIRGPVLLAEGQGIKASMRTQWTTNPSMIDARLIVAFLDGQLTRAAQ